MRDSEPRSTGRGLSRRRLLAGTAVVAGGGALAVGLAGGAVPGWSRMLGALDADGEDVAVPDVRPGRLLTGTFTSAARGGRSTGWTVALPPGSQRDLPVAVVLHGRGNDHASAFRRRYLGLDRFLAAAASGGVPPFALASVDGAETYWHARDDGDDTASMVVDELLPLLEGHGLRTGRIGLLGWSMGGFGALHLAGLLGRERVAGVAAMSPALWHDFEDTAPGAYDDAEDFAEVTVMGRQEALAGIPLRLDCGTGDPFASAVRDYVRGFPDGSEPRGGLQPGRHDVGYWRRTAPKELHFLGNALARPARSAAAAAAERPDTVSA
ncbi:alpha/beta hydrolase-fold protein [Mumia sp. DW29H23]|uniref:alpha/beta hydrolase n=1 Tax=Mumia sp. DW29H23 TaxID=3421241 RepID=UPI003D698864